MKLMILATLMSMSFFAYGEMDTDMNNEKMQARNGINLMFNETSEAKKWRTVNDGVMGGVSVGGMQQEKGFGVFSGVISLDNNGGFSSINRKLNDVTSSFNKASIDVKGDGQTYQLRLVTYVNGYQLAYKSEFETTAGARDTIIFDFQASFRGRLVTNAPKLRAENVREIVFLMTKKKPGPFRLEIHAVSLFEAPTFDV